MTLMLATGGSDPKHHFWPRNRVQISRPAMSNLLFRGLLPDRQGKREGETSGDQRLSRTLHLPALQVAIEAL